jgi:hypothetical protein
MTRLRNSEKERRKALCVGLGVAALLVAWSAAAQTPSPSPVPPAAGQAAPPQALQPAQPAGPGASTVPGYQPGLIDAVGRWMKESTEGFNANVNAALDALPSKGMGEAAGNAARSTTDAAKGAVEASQGVANAMGGVARDTAGALTRLPGARIAVGRERCAIAPNGAPDCQLAAQALCRASGLPGGSSIDVVTSENCPPDASLQRWRGATVVCTNENFVTRSLCQ